MLEHSRLQIIEPLRAERARPPTPNTARARPSARSSPRTRPRPALLIVADGLCNRPNARSFGLLADEIELRNVRNDVERLVARLQLQLPALYAAALMPIRARSILYSFRSVAMYLYSVDSAGGSCPRTVRMAVRTAVIVAQAM